MGGVSCWGILWDLSNTYWNVELRVENGLLCSRLASMNTILQLLVKSQCYFMDYLGEIIRDAWYVF